MNALQLTKKLISIPSYLSDSTNECLMGNFIFSYLRRFPYLFVTKQYIDATRFNVVAKTQGVPRLLLAGHMDTVEPKTGKSAQAITRGDRLYGLGGLDTKGGIGALLASLQTIQEARGITLLFYCDEEYDFEGMKRFVESEQQIGKIAVILEPTDLKIWNAHRGQIEISFSLQGVSGHASTPQKGKNAINGMMNALTQLQHWIAKFENLLLGKSVSNIACIRGGLYLKKSNHEEILLGKQGNNIADYAEAIMDIRPATSKLTAKAVQKKITTILQKSGYCLNSFSVRHDYEPLITEKSSITTVETILKQELGAVQYFNPNQGGFGDGQLLQKRFQIPVLYLGPKGKGMHAANEYVDIPSLEKLTGIFASLVRNYSR